MGHGSRLRGFEKTMKQVASSLRRTRKFFMVKCAYLEITAPSIPSAIDTCVKKGAGEVKIVPYFLLLGNHVKSDIPKIAAQAKKKHRGKTKILLCPYLGFHEKIVEVVTQRLEQAK